MNERKKQTIYRTEYGSATLYRTWCRRCQSMAIILSGVKQCCDRPYQSKNPEIQTVKMGAGDNKRKQYHPAAKKRILIKTNYACVYCFTALSLGTMTLDHFIPFTYSGSNREENTFACCHWCNRHKTSHVFTSIKETREYLLALKEKTHAEENLSDSEV